MKIINLNELCLMLCISVLYGVFIEEICLNLRGIFFLNECVYFFND